MKKMKFIGLVYLFAMLVMVSACSSSIDIEPRRAEEGEALEQAHFLYDLEHMLYLLENNFALFDVAYWARGVNIRTVIDNIRDYIASSPDITLDDFYDALHQHFAPLVQIGHFHIVSPQTHYLYVSTEWLAPWDMERLTQPNVLEFYEPRYYPQSDAGFDFERTPNVTTNIIEDGRIAYLSIDSFSNATFQERLDDEAQIFDFYYEIQEFDHLIIDLRRNRGGNPQFFPDAVIGPNISANLTIDGFAFVVMGEYSARFTENLSSREFPMTGIRFIDNELRPVAEILESFNLHDFNMADACRLDYGFRTQLTINPRRGIPNFDSNLAFNGNIWLLTGPVMGSSAQLAAWISKDTGFATLVGETTGGVFGGQQTVFTLPNSGIAFEADIFYVTDRHGRPLEAGTIPHHFNHQGMDALETTLAFISEGRY